MGLSKDNTFGVKECKAGNRTTNREVLTGDKDS